MSRKDEEEEAERFSIYDKKRKEELDMFESQAREISSNNDRRYRPHHGYKVSTTRLGDTSEVRALVQALSFGCSNLSYGSQSIGPHRLTASFPGGRVTVERVNGQEFVYIEKEEGNLFIVELVSQGKSYYGTYIISEREIKRIRKLKQFTDGYFHYFGFFEGTLLDIDTESCNYIHPMVASVSDDNMFLPVGIHKDDWHYNRFVWTGFPYSWTGVSIADQEDTWGHPGLNPGANASFSCSPLTYYQGHVHMHRSVCQNRRLYRPLRINLLKEDITDLSGDDRYIITSLDHEMYAKRPYTRIMVNGNLKQVTIMDKVVAGGVVVATVDYQEQVYLNGVWGSYAVNQWDSSQVDPTRYWWPFMPYMWEMSAYPIFYYSINDPVYGTSYWPEVNSYKKWNYSSISVTDGSPEEVTTNVEIHADEAAFHANHDTTDYTGWVPPHPSSPTPASGSWTNSSSGGREWDFNNKIHYPIAALGFGKDLYIVTTANGTGSIARTYEENNTKMTNFPLPYNYDTAAMQPGWWPLGGYSESNVHWYLYTEEHKTDISLTQKLMWGDIVIDTGETTMTYLANSSNRADYTGYTTCGIAEHPIAPLPFFPNVATWGYDDTVTHSFTVDGNGSRSMVCFEVLDYDSQTDFLYNGDYVHAMAVIYKKITITHTMSRIIDNSFTDTSMAQGHPDFSNMPNSVVISHGLPWDIDTIPGITGSVSDEWVATGSRKVEWILYVNVGGNVFRKTLDEVFTSSVSATNDTCNHSGAGSRVYGVNLKFASQKEPGVFFMPRKAPYIKQEYQKIPAGILVMSYDRDEFVAGQNVGANYDSAYNFEDWNNAADISEDEAGPKLWTYVNRVVGIFRVDGKGSFGLELMDEQDPITQEVYGVNARRMKTL